MGSNKKQVVTEATIATAMTKAATATGNNKSGNNHNIVTAGSFSKMASVNCRDKNGNNQSWGQKQQQQLLARQWQISTGTATATGRDK